MSGIKTNSEFTPPLKIGELETPHSERASNLPTSNQHFCFFLGGVALLRFTGYIYGS